MARLEEEEAAAASDDERAMYMVYRVRDTTCTKRTFREMSPNCKYRSGFLSGLCIPLLGHLRSESTKGEISSAWVSGMVKIGCASLSRGWMISMVDMVVVHVPFTRLGTAYGTGEVPAVLGSNVDHEGIVDM